MKKNKRNQLCSCGSGKKHKHCCGMNQPQDEPAISGIIYDGIENKIILVAENIIHNYFNRDNPKVEKSFDVLCKADVDELSKLFCKTIAIIQAGAIFGGKNHDHHRMNCGCLLMNTISTFTCALQLLRSGYKLQPGILIRNIVEAVSMVFFLIRNPDKLEAVINGSFKSTDAVKAAKELFPHLGPLYGFFSNQYAHLGNLYFSPQPPFEYKTKEDALQLNLSYLRHSLLLIYLTTELLFHDVVEFPRYWISNEDGSVGYKPSLDELKWQESFLRGSK